MEWRCPDDAVLHFVVPGANDGVMDQVCFRDGGYSPFPVSDWSHCIFRVLCKSNSDTTYGSLTKVPVQWFLELWDASHAVLGIIAIIAIQRAIQKILISVFLSREYKHDETNRAWWTGKWYGRGLGNSAMSQPAREFIVKIVEMSLWSGDFLLAHVLLMILTPPILIPFIDKLHSTMLCKFSLQRYIDTKSCILIFFPSLAASIKTNPCSIVFDQAEETKTMDRKFQ